MVILKVISSLERQKKNMSMTSVITRNSTGGEIVRKLAQLTQ
jgi:hypothetical protein